MRAIWIAVLTIVPLAACREDTVPPVVPEDLRNMEADQVMYGVETNMGVEGVREAFVQADTAFLWQDSSTVSLRQVRLTLFDENGRERAVVTALSGLLDDTSQRMVARGDVVLVVRQGNREIRSQELHYDPRQDRIWSDSATVMKEGNRIVEGTAFESDVEFRNLVVKNGRTRGGTVRF